MKANLLYIITAADKSYETLADVYQCLGTDGMVARARIEFPDIFIKEECVEEIDGEIQDETDDYILTWEDGMDECVRLYQKL